MKGPAKPQGHKGVPKEMGVEYSRLQFDKISNQIGVLESSCMIYKVVICLSNFSGGNSKFNLNRS